MCDWENMRYKLIYGNVIKVEETIGLSLDALYVGVNNRIESIEKGL